jgi:hypothetical protein
LQPQAGFGAEQQNQQSLALAFMQLSEQLGQLVGVGFQIGDHSVPACASALSGRSSSRSRTARTRQRQRWQIDDLAIMLATLGVLLRDLDIGAQLAACGQNLGAQLFADFGDQASENIAPKFIASGNRAFDPGVYKPRPVLRTLHFDLGNGRLVRDHTVCRTQPAPFVLRAVARSRKPPCERHLRADAVASTASHPAFVTIAIRPLAGKDGAS